MKNREFIPDLAIGDFDSLSEEGQKIYGKPEGTGDHQAEAGEG